MVSVTSMYILLETLSTSFCWYFIMKYYKRLQMHQVSNFMFVCLVIHLVEMFTANLVYCTETQYN